MNYQKNLTFKELDQRDKDLAEQIQKRLTRQSQLMTTGISDRMAVIKEQAVLLKENMQKVATCVQEHN